MSHEDDGSRRRRVLQGVGAMLGVGALAVLASADEHGADGGDSDGAHAKDGEEDRADDARFCLPDEDGLVTVAGGGSFEAAASAIEEAIESQEDLTLVTTVDHAQNAASVDEELPPTTLFLFGNPAAGRR